MNIGQFFLFAAYFFLFSLTIGRSKWFELRYISKPVLIIAFVLKALCGVVFTWLYTYYYSDRENADIYKYFDDGLTLQAIFFDSPKIFFQLLFEVDIENSEVASLIKHFNHWDPKVRSLVYNDSRFIIKLNALFSFISTKNIYIHSLFGGMMGFCGVVAFIKAVENLLPRFQSVAILLVFFPSIVFWTSSLLKETLIVLVFGAFVWILSLLQKKFSWRSCLYLIMLLFFLLLLKVYVMGFFLIALTAYGATAKLQNRLYVSIVFAVIVFVCIVAAYLTDSILLEGKLFAGIAQKQRDMMNLAIYMKSGSFIYVPKVFADKPFSFVQSGCVGIYNVLLQPLIWKVHSPFLAAAALENMLLWLLIFGFAFGIGKLSVEEWKLCGLCITFALMMFTLIGITTPILGSIVRYRVPGLMLLLVPLSIGWEQMLRIFNIRASSTGW